MPFSPPPAPAEESTQLLLPEWLVTHVQAAQRSDLVLLDVFFRWCGGEESCWVVRAFRVLEDRMLTSPKPGRPEIRPNK